MRRRIIRAVFLRELAGYFTTPTGYVFMTLFVFLSALAAFWQERFFAANLANLDQLNGVFPYLLVFLAPAIAMGLWAEERKQGTDELLLTLPARDWELVLGKYLAAVAIYTVALGFSLSHVVVLCWLGSPDPGLICSTYLGYWLAGTALLALGMVASLVTDNLTVAFLLGTVLCAVPVFVNHAGVILSGGARRLVERLSVVEQFQDLSHGVVTAGSVVYFLSFAAAMLYLNVLLVGRRRWRSGPKAPRMKLHVAGRTVALIALVGSATVLAGNLRLRLDVTAEQIHSLAPETRRLLKGLSPRQPVFIHAYLSPEVPRGFLEVRANLAGMLREFDAVGGESVHTRIVETVKYSPEAREALERYGIRAYRVPITEESTRAINEIFLGLACTCGSEEFVIPFFDRGLPVEYELMRSVRVVSRSQRRKVGMLATGVKLFGGFDFQNKVQAQEWSIVAELRKQYEVLPVAADTDFPADLDVLVAALPWTLTGPQLERLTAYVKRGRPALVLLDPMPGFDLNLAPQEIRQAGPFQMPSQGGAKTDIRPLLEALGVSWQSTRIAWDNYNPHPQLKTLPKEFVFVGRGFNQKEAITAGLQEVVLLYPGVLKAWRGTEFTALLETTRDSGVVKWEDLVQRSLFGIAVNPGLQHLPQQEAQVLAARVRGRGAEPVNAIVVADVDLMGEQFFELRRRGIEGLHFDNVTFLLNAVDELAGDASFIALRKRRPRHRTLEAVEARTKSYEARRLRETLLAEGNADQRLKEAQARLDRAVRDLEQRSDLDAQTRQIMIANVQTVENRRLTVARANIEDERQRHIETARAEMEGSVRAIQNAIKLLAVVLPPAPAFVVFLLVSLRRLKRERLGALVDRLTERG